MENGDELKVSALINLRNDMTELQKKTAQHEFVVSKLDSAIEKISEVSVNVSKILAVHEQRIEVQEKITRSVQDYLEVRRKETEETFSDMHDKIASQEQAMRQEMVTNHKEILTEIKSLRVEMNDLGTDLKDQHAQDTKALELDFNAKLDAMSAKVSTMERLMWISIGGASVIGFALSQLAGYLQVFS